MSGEAEVAIVSEAARTRPLSGGLWSLLSWLRRDDRSSSSDSLSSAGSDRTAVSFHFLAPPLPRNHASPLPPLAPPTDSYRKRVRDRNQRRQHDRDLTLHRKYGLYYGFDAFSLPHARKSLNESVSEQDRDRRAASESLPRPTAHVPGKRRAPLPPARAHSVTPTSSLVRRHNRKRPAPQPPVKLTEKVKENFQTSQILKSEVLVQMNPNSEGKRHLLSNVNGDQSDKYGKKNSNVKDIKPRAEKSFLKQIFENKKRNSIILPAPERILPSISELDKQAAEIIEARKLKPLEQNNNLSIKSSSQRETWFCTRCLRKYECTIVTCQYCLQLPEQKRLSNELVRDTLNDVASTSSNTYTQTEKEASLNGLPSRISGIGAEEKQKLKEMLKEMKDSLPKRPKHDSGKPKERNVFAFEAEQKNTTSLETPTLRIGSIIDKEVKSDPSQPSTSKQNSTNENTKLSDIPNIEKILPKIKPLPVTENVLITQHVVLVGPQPKAHDLNKPEASISVVNDEKPKKQLNTDRTEERPNKHLNTTDYVEINNVHTPLRISSLLNPVYIPKPKTSDIESKRNLFFSQGETHGEKSEKMALNLVNEMSSPNKVKPVILQINNSQQGSNQNDEKPSGFGVSSAINVTAPSKQKLEESHPKSGPSMLPASTELRTSSYNASGTTNALLDKAKLISSNMVKFTVDQHSRRRELINQLEQSISSGDERAAADAAVKLAQLRLSCSVLSFTSQIMAETTKTNSASSNVERLPVQNANKETEPTVSSQIKQPLNKVNAVQTQPLNIVDAAQTQPPNKVNASVQSVTTVSSNLQTNNKGLISAKKIEDQPNKSSPAVDCKLKIIDNKIDVSSRKPLSAQPSTSKQSSNVIDNNIATIEVWVEDREATRGPVHLRIPKKAAMGELRQQAEATLGLAYALQRWIVGRALCTDDRTPLVALAGPDLAAPFYLCVVESGNTEIKIPNRGIQETSDVYSELVQLEQRALIVNAEPFECTVCMEECKIGGGAVLRECVHSFCRECLSDLIRHCEEPVVSCPAMGCPGVLQEREIRTLVTPEEYERWLARGLAAAESGTRNAFHCRTRDCTGWALCDPGVRRFPCPVCKHSNCIPCQAIHEGETCDQYRAKQETTSTQGFDQTDEGTQALLETLITKGEALKCPECSAIITKKWGCDWVKCSACKTEICWVTRGRRWGPNGKGDTSGGCRCGVDGKKCHPSCGYCH